MGVCLEVCVASTSVVAIFKSLNTTYHDLTNGILNG